MTTTENQEQKDTSWQIKSEVVHNVFTQIGSNPEKFKSFIETNMYSIINSTPKHQSPDEIGKNIIACYRGLVGTLININTPLDYGDEINNNIDNYEKLKSCRLVTLEDFLKEKAISGRSDALRARYELIRLFSQEKSEKLTQQDKELILYKVNDFFINNALMKKRYAISSYNRDKIVSPQHELFYQYLKDNFPELRDDDSKKDFVEFLDESLPAYVYGFEGSNHKYVFPKVILVDSANRIRGFIISNIYTPDEMQSWVSGLEHDYFLADDAHAIESITQTVVQSNEKKMVLGPRIKKFRESTYLLGVEFNGTVDLVNKVTGEVTQGPFIPEPEDIPVIVRLDANINEAQAGTITAFVQDAAHLKNTAFQLLNFSSEDVGLMCHKLVHNEGLEFFPMLNKMTYGKLPPEVQVYLSKKENWIS